MDSHLEKYFAAPWVEFCREYGGMPLLYGPVDNLYATLATMFSTIMAKFEIPPTDTSISSEDIRVNENLRVRVYTPPSPSSQSSLGIYYHGGGWVLCDLDSEDAICRLVSKTLSMVIVSVDYRLAPKHEFPLALNDCVDAFDWAVANAAKLKVRDTKVTIMGGSAGGNLAIGAALKLIDEGRGGPIGGVVALVPVTIHPDAVPVELKGKHSSYEENADLTLNTKSAMLEFWNAYNAPIDDIYTSCLLHPRLHTLPKTYIAECGVDTLRDDARLMRDALQEAGVALRYEAFPGYPHWSWTFPSAVLSEHANDFFAKFFDAIRWTQS